MEALRRANDRISACATRSSFIFVSHYHEDHFRSDPATYAGRLVLAKDPQRMTVGRQGGPGRGALEGAEGHARVESADGIHRRESHSSSASRRRCRTASTARRSARSSR